MNVIGFNHLTLNIKNLNESLEFYEKTLEMDVIHVGNKDAYLQWGSAWICLQERPQYSTGELETIGVDHVAFSISEEDFHKAVEKLQTRDVKIVRGPIKRGTGWAINFLDPNGIQLELHTSSLKERMKVWS